MGHQTTPYSSNCKPSDQHKIWILLAALIQCAFCAEEYNQTPGSVSVLEGGPANMSFLPALSNDEIFWCYWEYRGCENHGMCSTEPFIGYNKYDGRRENISRRHQGWLFENTDRPCQGGIWRTVVEQQHQGWYRMVYDNMDRTEFRSDFFPLTRYAENALNIKVSSNGTTANINLSEGKSEPVKLESINGAPEAVYMINVSPGSGMPPDTKYTIIKSVDGGGSFATEYCSAKDGVCEAQASLGLENDVRINILVDSGIQGYPVVEIVQPFDYTGISSAATAFAIILALLLVTGVLVTWFVILPWYAKKQQQKKDIEKGLLVENLKTEKQELENKNAEQAERIKSLVIDLECKENARRTIAEDWAKKDEECKKLQGELTMIRTENDDLKHQKKSLQTDCETASKTNKDLVEKMRRLEEELLELPVFVDLPKEVIFEKWEKSARIDFQVTGKPNVTVQKEVSKTMLFGTKREDINLQNMKMKLERSGNKRSLVFADLESRHAMTYFLKAENKKGTTIKPVIVTIGKDGVMADQRKEFSTTPNSTQNDEEEHDPIPPEKQCETKKAPRFLQFPRDVVFQLHEQQAKLIAEVMGNPRPTVKLCTLSRMPTNPAVDLNKLDITQDIKEDVYTWIIKEVTKQHAGEYVLEAENGIGGKVKHNFKIKAQKPEDGRSGKGTKSDSRQQRSGQVGLVNEKETTDENVPRSTADTTSAVDPAQEVLADDQKRVSGSDQLKPKAGPTGAGPTGPRIIKGLVDCSFTSQQPATLLVEAEGDGPLTATWSIDGSPFHSEYVKLYQKADGNFTLYMKHVTGVLRGKIKCVVEDGYGRTAATEANVHIVVATGTA